MVPGWGFGETFWDPLRARLKPFETDIVDLGFLTGRPSTMPTTPSETVTIAIGHSFGFAWLLNRKNHAWDAYIAINGFTRFSHAPDFRHGIAGRILDRMIAKFDQSPRDVVADFHRRCGAADPPGDFDHARMKTGLIRLRDWDFRVAYQRLDMPGLVLAGAVDKIVKPGMTNDCFHGRKGVQMHWHETGGHLLPQSDPDWCADHIRAFVQLF